MTTSLLAGIGLGFSLIIAIGAQNVYVLRQGIRREHVLAVVLVCALSDAALIVLGISGIGAIVTAVPWLVDVVRWAGAAFLVGYGILAARRAIRGGGLMDAAGESQPSSTASSPGGTLVATRTATLGSVIGTTVALTWLNPHVYLDTVFLLGSVANTHGDARWVFGAGAVIASIVWFAALGFGARHLGRVVRTPRAWRIVDGAIALIMITLGLLLVIPH
ncbi:LysE/ArgO family amino acid transporter [Agromyces atrinae]|uniref:Amino acid transporter n=1 Tax=Agromyces atrinae TaxID=592376 RepID=A0A4Q2MCT9_9MICO|nr:LysE/ArgO family amino acid transporter [Agromyces atrinae]NYD67258.1 L-lysine exporter family protein LysE/ArgO [Agromyces atrinae]RXZ86910.1 amino acid transporter [Agromyces atrinae]